MRWQDGNRAKRLQWTLICKVRKLWIYDEGMKYEKEGNLGTVTSVNDEMIETVYPYCRTLTPKWCYKAWHRKVEWGKQISLFTYMEGDNGKD